ncbi:MAG: hypothetical protein ABEH56_00265 [Salinirussus sp.]
MAREHRTGAFMHGNVSRADLILVLVPLVFVGVYATGVLAFDGRLAPVACASIACCLLIADGLFWHPPRDS